MIHILCTDDHQIDNVREIEPLSNNSALVKCAILTVVSFFVIIQMDDSD